MRLLRSQYLKLSNNANSKAIQNPIIAKKTPSCLNNIDCNNNHNEMIILSQTSTHTTTTTKTRLRCKSLVLNNNEVNEVNSDVNSKLDDLYGFNKFPESTDPSQPERIKHRRQTMACPSGVSLQQNHTMQIKFKNVPEAIRKINITVEFVDMGALWLTRIYQSYENDLWQKMIRPIPKNKKYKYFFYCLLCFDKYCKFETLKGHLNQHLELYPYGCKLCTLQFTNRGAITRHLRSKHHIERNNWNEYIGN